ncbi:hypothetical protein [Ammoniphilus resinae]|uniref:Uncharacterized protein n=1 Tax=Ammoniphilus resinae TaxID=861532 RepID=A0ABS4GU29_9BACL|nr:hypothetical protein [Ammoniphilus resinae]MBP1933783.1 hypothetical protein [Ammoniphilus resinae]
MTIYKRIALLLCLLPLLCTDIEAKENATVTIMVKSSPYSGFVSHLVLQDQSFVKRLVKGMKQSKGQGDLLPELPYAYIEITQKGKTERYTIGYSLNLYHFETGKKVLLSQPLKDELESSILLLRKHHFGRDVSWEEANQLFPRMDFAQVIDLETGLSFRVQRRAGSQHADVQPASAEDTVIMKRIYNGKWSWKRRAILIKVNGKILAASMHGMPHGGGAITWNNFPGHFCIHFKNSTTHRRSYPDPGHDLMVDKASGHILQKIVQGTPDELIQIFLAAAQEQDYSMIQLMLNQADAKSIDRFINQLQDLDGFRLYRVWTNQQRLSPLYVEQQADILIKRKGEQEEKITLPFIFSRTSLLERWKLDIHSTLDLLDK